MKCEIYIASTSVQLWFLLGRRNFHYFLLFSVSAPGTVPTQSCILSYLGDLVKCLESVGAPANYHILLNSIFYIPFLKVKTIAV